MDNIITVKNLQKSYGQQMAVRGIELAVSRGQLFAFLGRNGAGKSTAIDIICTLLKPDAGEIVIDGCRLGVDDDAIRRRIGAVFQDSVLDDRLTVRENLSVRARFYMQKKEQIRAAIQLVSDVADLGEFLDRRYGKLSGGQRRRVDIARALLNTPKILFLDEPTTGLDPQTRRNVWDMIARLQKEMNLTVFLTTHYMEEAAKADFVMIIDKGEIVTSGTPFALRERYSADLLKVKPQTERRADFLAQLAKGGFGWEEKEGVVHIQIKTTQQAISLLAATQEWVDSFEMIHGTMDDVFLNVTGAGLEVTR
jgi:multidrug/hemolysin transport system ATP-binding protein